MTEIKHRTIKTNGINMHIAEAGAGPLVLMLHGFPELWYSWRHQIPALAEAGYHAVAPDVRGYGQSDAPQPIEAYAMTEHLADAAGILDALGAETAVVVGHDWGSPMAWTSALTYPERYRAVVGLSVPFIPRSPAPPMQLFKQIFQDNFFYMLYFQEPGVAEKEFEKDPRRSMRLFLYAASGDAPRFPQTWAFPSLSARCAWRIATSGASACTAIIFSLVNGASNSARPALRPKMSEPIAVYVGRKGTPRAAACRASATVKLVWSTISTACGMPSSSARRKL